MRIRHWCWSVRWTHCGKIPVAAPHSAGHVQGDIATLRSSCIGGIVKLCVLEINLVKLHCSVQQLMVCFYLRDLYEAKSHFLGEGLC